MTGLHGSSSTKPELTQHHGQMACRTTPALTYLSLILCVSCSICATPPSLPHSISISLPFHSFNSFYHSLSVAKVSLRTLSSVLSICLLFCLSFLMLSLSKCPQLTGLSSSNVNNCTNIISMKPNCCQIKSTKTATHLGSMRKCKLDCFSFLALFDSF